MLVLWKKNYDEPWQCIKKQRHYFADKGSYSQSYGFSRSYVWMWKLDHKGGWEPKNWCFWTKVLEKTLKSPLDSKSKPDNLKGNQSWIFIGRIDAEAEALILWPPDEKSRIFGKDPDTERVWEQEEKGVTEDEIVGWHHQLNGHDYEQTPGYSEGQGSLACWSLWGHKESDRTEWFNWQVVEQWWYLKYFSLPGCVT